MSLGRSGNSCSNARPRDQAFRVPRPSTDRWGHLRLKRNRSTLVSMSERSESEPKKFTLKPKVFERVNVPAREPAPTPTSVHQVLEQNKQVAAQFEKPLEFRPRPNQRRKDYLILMFVGNGLIGLGLLLLPKNIMITAFAISAIVVFSLAVTWVVYGVMDRY